MTDTRTYIRVHDGMPDHPKVDGLSDRAFRLLVESWCWCSRHLTDGRIPPATWRKRGTPKARKELAAAGLIEEQGDGGVVLHDYLEHQRSAAEVALLKGAKSRGGAYGNHKRWHLDRGVTDPECGLCAIGGPIGSGSQDGRPTVASTTTQAATEQPPTAVVPGAATSSSSGGRALPRAEDDERASAIEGRIIEVVAEKTGRVVDRRHAAAIRRELLDGRAVDNALAYVAAAIRAQPQRYLPATNPADRPPPVRRPRDPDAAERGAAQARALLTTNRTQEAEC